MADIREMRKGSIVWSIGPHALFEGRPGAAVDPKASVHSKGNVPETVISDVTKGRVVTVNSFGNPPDVKIRTIFSTTDSNQTGVVSTYPDVSNIGIPSDPHDGLFDVLGKAGITVVDEHTRPDREENIRIVRMPINGEPPEPVRENLSLGLTWLDDMVSIWSRFNPAADNLLRNYATPELLKELLEPKNVLDSLTTYGVPMAITIPHLFHDVDGYTELSEDIYLPPIAGRLVRLVGSADAKSYYGIAVIPDLTGKEGSIGYAAVKVTPDRGPRRDPQFTASLLEEHLPRQDEQQYVRGTELTDVAHILTRRMYPQTPRGIRI